MNFRISSIQALLDAIQELQKETTRRCGSSEGHYVIDGQDDPLGNLLALPELILNLLTACYCYLRKSAILN